jgi:hypothetical protein
VANLYIKLNFLNFLLSTGQVEKSTPSKNKVESNEPKTMLDEILKSKLKPVNQENNQPKSVDSRFHLALFLAHWIQLCF